MSPYLKGALGATAALIVGALLYTMYVDHQMARASYNWIVQNQAKIAKLP